MKINKLVLATLIISSLSSCVSSKKILYFQDHQHKSSTEQIEVFETKIQTADLLYINVSALNPEAALPFNLYETPIIAGSFANARPLNYLVDVQGDINFPILGTIKVAGLTTKELTQKLKEQLTAYLKDPIINIRFVNFKVTVIGEVKNPGVFSVANERITIMEALGLAGDLGLQASRKHVVLMREANGQRNFVTIDLTKKDLVNSPYYYMAQNDVIYVSPNKTKINSSGVGSNTSVIISSVSLLLTLTALIIRL